MKSVKITYLCSCICGLILFVLGITLLFNIKNTPAQVTDNNATPSNASNSFDIVENYTGNMNPINFLVLIKEASGLNTDSIIVANYSPETRQISLLTIPRDTKASTRASYKVNSAFYLGLNKNKASDKLTEAEQKHKAAEHAAQIVSNLTDIKIDYYIYLEIDTIKEIIDRLGGVYFDVPAKLKYNDPTQGLHIDLEKGYQLLDGDKSEQLLRFRKPHTSYYTSKELKEVKKYYDGSDLKRTEMQIRFVNAIIEQKVNLLDLPKLIPIINFAFDHVITNTSLSDTLSLFRAFTQASRPEMNTYKLYGIDRRINDADFFIYNNTVENTKTREIFNSDEIIEKYFVTQSGKFVPDEDNHYDFQAILRDNPSNEDTDSKGDNQDKP
ncbi:MAG: cell envelope-related function transcriptional attenuator common domain protein [Eubacterium sp.]|nr:cell envelope-related function transcriptional attenuator common domain protein [Eubacterium sp.]